jgi:hypothetical protein
MLAFPAYVNPIVLLLGEASEGLLPRRLKTGEGETIFFENP